MAGSDIANPTAPTQRKRDGKRTARACDECRMRKSKCDGLQPCEACQSTDRYCTYNLSAGRSTGSGTRIRILEDRLRRARAYLNEAQKRTPSLAHVNFDALLGPTDDHASPEAKTATDGGEDGDDQGDIQSMMGSYGQMNINSNGNMERDFYGAASGLAWIRRTNTYFDDSESPASDVTDEAVSNNSATVQLFDAPLPPKNWFASDTPLPQLLPPRETSLKLLHVVFTQVYPFFHFLDEEDFQNSMDRIYNQDPAQYQEEDRSFLVLLYFVVGIGYLFSRDEHIRQGCGPCVTQGMVYFTTARLQMDIAHLRTTVSLQSVVCLVLFLVSTARMASAHAFLGAACAAAMRQGLHFRSSHHFNLADKEKRVRRRIFWAVLNLDMYVSGVLGLCPFMDLSAIDPAIDLTIESALKEARLTNGASPADGLALAASAKHIELMRVLFKTQKTLFPKPTDLPDAVPQGNTISVSVRALQEVETQYRLWALSLTDILTHPDQSPKAEAVKYELHICYYFAQIVLYRAFLHYLAKQNDGATVNQRQLSYAQTCVRMAQKVVDVSIKHQRKGLLCPASWPSVYTVFIAVVCLIFAYATRRESNPMPEAKEYIENGIRLLASTACTTETGSVRCLEVLRRLIKRLSCVDVDLDQICADTLPCCTSDFTPTKERPTMNEEVLHIPMTGPGRLDSVDAANSSSSGSQFVPDMQQWGSSPDMRKNQPSSANSDHFTAEPETQDPSHLWTGEEMMDIAYGGSFNWQGHDIQPYHLGHPRQGSLGGSRSGSQQSSRHEVSQGRSSSQQRLSSADIAAFMHTHTIDESFRKHGGHNQQ